MDKAEYVGRNVTHDACRGQIAVAAPHEWRARVGKNIDVHRSLEQNKVTDLTAIDKVFRQIVRRILGKVVSNARNEATLASELGELRGFRRRRGKRLLAVDVLACLERCLGNLIVHVIGEADVDEIDIWICKNISPVL
jgi:hypothetical protein